MRMSEILSSYEIELILDDLTRRGWSSVIPFRNRTIFRLAVGCGLRRKEIAGLNLGDIVLSGPRPVIRVRKEVTKGVQRGGKIVRIGREVPLWWDTQNLEHLREWVDFRDGDPMEPFACKVRGEDHERGRMTPFGVSDQFKSALSVLGKERVSQLSAHSGRHSFISHALVKGRSLVEVRDAAGHSSIATTSIYAHMIERDNVEDFLPRTKVEEGKRGKRNVVPAKWERDGTREKSGKLQWPDDFSVPGKWDRDDDPGEKPGKVQWPADFAWPSE